MGMSDVSLSKMCYDTLEEQIFTQRHKPTM